MVRGYDLDWLRKGLLRETREGLAQGHKWIPKQDLPFTEIVLYAYAAELDLTERLSHCRACISLMAGALTPTLKIPDNLPQTPDMPVRIAVQAPTKGATPTKRTPEEEARDILAAAAKNQVESGPGTRRA